MNPWIYVAIAAVVLVVLLLALVPKVRRRRAEGKREEAGRLREAATSQESTIRQREQEALSADQDAERARVEADRLEAGASQLQADASTMCHEQLEQLTKADEIDPDVNRAGEGYLPPGSPERDAAETTQAQVDADDFAEHQHPQGPAEPGTPDPQHRA